MDNRKIKIVAVDDSQGNLSTLRALLLDVFPEALVLTALSVQEGFELAATEAPDLIFLDMVMAVQDGFAVCTKLKADNTLCDIPLVFLTNDKTDRESRKKALKFGAEGFLAKPIDESELTAKILSMIKIKNVKKEHALINAIFDSIPGYLYVYDESGKLIKWNKRHETMTGYTTEELSCMTLQKWFDEEDIIKVNAAVDEVFQKGYGEVEASLILKTGEKMMIRSTGVPLVSDGQKYFIGIGIDISVQKKLESELRESEQRFQLLFEKAPLGYQSLDFDGRFIEVNQKWLNTLGYNKDEVIGKWFGDFLCPEYVEGFRKRFPIFKSQGSIHSEYEMLSKDGHRLFMSFDGKIGNGIDGKFKQTHCILQDITDQKKAEKDAKESADRFYSLFNTMSSGVAIYKVLGDGSAGKDYIVQSFNHAALQMENKELPEVQGKSLFDLRPAIDNYGLISIFQKVWKNGEPAFFPSKAYIDDNYCNWYENRIFKLSTGEIVAIYDDVTDKTLANIRLAESEKKYSSYIENAPNAVSITDRSGRYLDANNAASLMTGYTREELLKMNWRDLTSDQSKNRAAEPFGILTEKGFVRGELQYIHKNGSKRWRSIDAVKLSEDTYLSFSSDITDRLQVEDALRRSEERFRVAQEMSPDGFTILHPVRNEAGKTIDFTWVYENQAIACMNQTDPKEVIGKRVLDVFPRHSGTSIFETYKKAADTGEVQIIEEVNVGEVISTPIWLRLVVVSMGEDIAILAQDITQRKIVESKLLHLSYHDQLSGLYNRRFFEEEIKRIDMDQNLPLSVIMCDVNGLKLVNDSFGHASGDMILKRAAEAIRKACREKDVIARVGGDEFVVLLPGTTAKETLQIANQIKEHQSAESTANIELSISYGYDTKTTDKQSLIEILANAENHMYRHKLYERSSLRSKTIDLIMNTLFEKSSREEAHSSRVSNICHAIATKMNLDEHTVNQVRIAGLIHDIGKIGIDESILNKTGNLSLEERSDVERHPETGWRILSSTDEFSDLAEFILNHHEKWDGSGYPNHIKGEEIQLEARIIAIADAYDAMTSQRSYRNVLSKEEAIQELTRCSGTQFDPRIIDVFVNQVLPEQSNFQNMNWGDGKFSH